MHVVIPDGIRSSRKLVTAVQIISSVLAKRTTALIPARLLLRSTAEQTTMLIVGNPKRTPNQNCTRVPSLVTRHAPVTKKTRCLNGFLRFGNFPNYLDLKGVKFS